MTNSVVGATILGGLLNNGMKLIRESQDVFIKETTDAETEARSILENHPKREEILNIIRGNDEEQQKAKLERLFDNKNVQSEVITFDPVPAALLAIADSQEQCHPNFGETAKKYKDTIPLIILKNSKS